MPEKILRLVNMKPVLVKAEVQPHSITLVATMLSTLARTRQQGSRDAFNNLWAGGDETTQSLHRGQSAAPMPHPPHPCASPTSMSPIS